MKRSDSWKWLAGGERGGGGGRARRGSVKEEEVNVEKPRRNPRRRCIDSAANSPACLPDYYHRLPGAFSLSLIHI